MEQIKIKNNLISLSLLDYGAILQEIVIQDKVGNFHKVVVGHENPLDYIQDTICLGACVGRHAGRISDGGFTLNDKYYSLHTENGIHLHGGKNGFQKKYWTIKKVHTGINPYVKMSYTSASMEEGYPGNLEVSVTYSLRHNALHIIFEAVTDTTTVVNLTNHSYFKLDNAPSVHDYELQLNAPYLLETYTNGIPSGKVVPTKNTPYDFTRSKRIKESFLDTPYVLDTSAKQALRVYSKKSGIYLDVETNQPAMVVFTSKAVPAICFEAQGYPNAANIASFPSTMLHVGETYRNETVFKFGFVP